MRSSSVPVMLFQQCATFYPKDGNDSGAALLQCISDHVGAFQHTKEQQYQSTTEWILFFCAALVFSMQPGFTMIAAGFVRKKNLQNTMLKNILDVCTAAIGFYTFGYAFAYGGQSTTSAITWIGSSNFFVTTTNEDDHINYAFWFYQFVLSASTVSIVAGTLAERCKMISYMMYCLYISGFVYPVLVHTIWSRNGWLSTSNMHPYRGIGVIDFAGAGVIHMTGGGIALIASKILGARVGRFHDADGIPLDKPCDIQGHSVVLQTLGAFLLWFGWFGFNGGSALSLTRNTIPKAYIGARAVTKTFLAGSTGALSALILNFTIQHRCQKKEYAVYDLGMTVNGALSGLVGVTSACGTIDHTGAIVVGIVAGFIYYGGKQLLDYHWKIDDVVCGIPIHLFNGIWAMLATGLFSTPDAMMEAYGTDQYIGLFYEFGRGDVNGVLFTNQIIGICIIIVWISITTTPVFFFINYMGWFRSENYDEVVGLDLRYHGDNATRNRKKDGEEKPNTTNINNIINNINNREEPNESDAFLLVEK